MMSFSRTRDDLVGKRFLSVPNGHGNKLKISRVSDWPWKSGLIRCASHLDSKDPELQVQPKFYFLENISHCKVFIPMNVS